MKFEELKETEKSAVIYLYFLEEMSKKSKLKDGQKKDMNSIQSSLGIIKTDTIPLDEKIKVDLKVLEEIRFLKKRN